MLNISQDDGCCGFGTAAPAAALQAALLCKLTPVKDLGLVVYTELEVVDFPGSPVVNNPPANAGDMVRSLVWGDPTCGGTTKALCRRW